MKINAVELLKKELDKRARREEYGFIAVSTATEPYQDAEKQICLTRKILETVLQFRFPVHILTKSPLVLRDVDILRQIDKNAVLPQDLIGKVKRGAIVNFSFSTLDEGLARIVEPGVPMPEERLKAIAECKKEGLFAGASLIPALPLISDSAEKLEEALKIFKGYGADFVFVGTLTLFGNKETDSKLAYYRVLKRNFPGIADAYEKIFGESLQIQLQYGRKLRKISEKICKKVGIKCGIL